MCLCVCVHCGFRTSVELIHSQCLFKLYFIILFYFFNGHLLRTSRRKNKKNLHDNHQLLYIFDQSNKLCIVDYMCIYICTCNLTTRHESTDFLKTLRHV